MAIDTQSPSTNPVAKLDTLVRGSHAVKITKLTDSAQFFSHLASCSCGTEGRFNSEDEARSFAENHFQRRGLKS